MSRRERARGDLAVETAVRRRRAEAEIEAARRIAVIMRALRVNDRAMGVNERALEVPASALRVPRSAPRVTAPK